MLLRRLHVRPFTAPTVAAAARPSQACPSACATVTLSPVRACVLLTPIRHPIRVADGWGPGETSAPEYAPRTLHALALGRRLQAASVPARRTRGGGGPASARRRELTLNKQGIGVRALAACTPARACRARRHLPRHRQCLYRLNAPLLLLQLEAVANQTAITEPGQLRQLPRAARSDSGIVRLAVVMTTRWPPS
eukprot:scaffold723_cov363-Prasinococcus_capsulatus_cf.AAC.12